MISSFDLDSLITAHQSDPEIPLIYNFETNQTIEDARHVLSEHSYLYGLCLPIATVNESIVKLLHNDDKYIAAYTCNSYAEISKALKLKLDIIITDVPKKALKMRGS
jgi:glycerophosphoryl diester phosphodiesterase